MSKELLTIVGTGIKFLSHLTLEAKVYIEQSNFVLYLVNDPAIQNWIQQHNPNTESLDQLYYKFNMRHQAYEEIGDYIIDKLKDKKKLCVAFYGHPTFLVQPAIYAAEKAYQEGYEVNILPGISSEACLFADLRIDPSSCGCLSFETTDFLVYKRQPAPSSHLILWQIGLLGVVDQSQRKPSVNAIQMLITYLMQWYPATHEIYLYEAAQYPGFEPIIKKIPLNNIDILNLTPRTTLYIPPTILLSADKDIYTTLTTI